MDYFFIEIFTYTYTYTHIVHIENENEIESKRTQRTHVKMNLKQNSVRILLQLLNGLFKYAFINKQ